MADVKAPSPPPWRVYLRRRRRRQIAGVAALLLVAGLLGWGFNRGAATPNPAVGLHGREVVVAGWRVEDGRVIVQTNRGPLHLLGVTPAGGGAPWLEQTLRPGRRVELRLDPELHGGDPHPAYRLRDQGTDLAELGLRAGVLRVDRRRGFRRLGRYAALEELADRDR